MSLFSHRLGSVWRGAVALPRRSDRAPPVPPTTAEEHPLQPQNAPSTRTLCRTRTLHVLPPILGLSGPMLLHSSVSDIRRQFLDYLPSLPVITTDNAPQRWKLLSAACSYILKKLTYGKNARFAVMVGNSPL